MTELSPLVRWLHLAASVLLVGRFAFAALILRRLHATSFLPRYETLQSRITTGCLIVALLTHLAALTLQVALVSQSAVGVPALVSFVAGTRYGKVWFGRLLLLSLLALLCLSRGAALKARQSAATRSALLLSSLHLAALALSGHAAAAEGSALVLQVGADALHLLASGVWLGGLVPLAILLGLAGGATDDVGFVVIQTSVQRFSDWALLSMMLIVLTGSLNAWNLIGGLPQLFGTEYGRLLLAKLALLLPLVAVAARNLRRFRPNLGAPVTSNGQFIEGALKLRRSVIVETTLGLAILLIVGHLGVTPPARHVQPDWPFAFRWDWSVLDKAPRLRAEFDRGMVWAGVGAAALLCAMTRSRRRLVTALSAIAALAYAGYVLHNVGATDAYPTTYKRPGVSYNAISVANGAALYQDSGCVSCHGLGGYGDGPNAADLNPKPADLTAAHANAHTAGDLYWWLSHGVKPASAMPGFSASLSTEERWDLINYLRALSTGEKARSLAPVIEDKPWLVAPDFAYSTESGESLTLREHRGNKIVLLAVLDLRNTEQRVREIAGAVPQLRAAGVETIVVPQWIDRQFVAGKLPQQMVDEGIREITETYKLFARSFNSETVKDAMPHVEYLIDKQGYIRARWLSAENSGWRNIEQLMKQIESLQKEKPSAPAPEEHVH